MEAAASLLNKPCAEPRRGRTWAGAGGGWRRLNALRAAGRQHRGDGVQERLERECLRRKLFPPVHKAAAEAQRTLLKGQVTYEGLSGYRTVYAADMRVLRFSKARVKCCWEPSQTGFLLRQMQGIIINGCIRDSDDISRMPLGVKALNTYPLKSSKRDPGLRNIPVAFGGVIFRPGDWVYADKDGIIVSPEELKLS